MLELPPLSLYIHIPWCIRKCPYCDFNSHAADGELPEQEYLQALLDDFSADLAHVGGRELQSIFIGGGTPSLMSPGFYDRLLDQLNDGMNFSAEIEITLEANPGSVEASRFADYRSLGINRLSLGIQSFSDHSLTVLGRIHDSSEARNAIDIGREAGFDNFNLDIMYALPNQTPEQALADLQEAVKFEPAHLSWYQLTVEPNTAFFSKPPVLPAEDSVLSMMDAGLTLLEREGLQRYEISAYALPGRQSRHNLNYWQFGDYLGIGAGASGKITRPNDNQIVRTRKVRQPSHYLSCLGDYLAERHVVEQDSLDIEFMMNSLRLTGGFEADLYERRTGNSFSAVRKKLECLQDEGMLRLTSSRVVPTEKGVLFTNNLLEQFL
jgi:putative oxygen-independent coproporphyrinogen III oxidase